MLADRDGNVPTRSRWNDDLDTRPVGKACRQQGMLAADALMTERSHLLRQTREQLACQRGLLGALDLAAERFEPDFTGPVDIDVGDVSATQREGQRGKIAAEIDQVGHWRVH